MLDDFQILFGINELKFQVSSVQDVKQTLSFTMSPVYPLSPVCPPISCHFTFDSLIPEVFCLINPGRTKEVNVHEDSEFFPLSGSAGLLKASHSVYVCVRARLCV